MAVVVVGNLPEAEIQEKIKTYFSGLKNPNQKLENTAYSIPVATNTSFLIASDQEALTNRIRVIKKHRYSENSGAQGFKNQITQQLTNRLINSILYKYQQTQNPHFTFASMGYGRSMGDLSTFSWSVTFFYKYL